MSRAPRPAPKRCSPRAPAFASFSSCTSSPSRARISATGSTPPQLAMIPSTRAVPETGIDRRGHAHADAEHARRVHARLAQHALNELAGEVEARLRRVVDRGARPVLGHRAAGEVAERGADVLVAEVEADRERGAGRERDAQRRAPHRPPVAVRLRALLHDARGLQLVDQRRHASRARARCGGRGRRGWQDGRAAPPGRAGGSRPGSPQSSAIPPHSRGSVLQFGEVLEGIRHPPAKSALLQRVATPYSVRLSRITTRSR